MLVEDAVEVEITIEVDEDICVLVVGSDDVVGTVVT